MYFCNVNLYGAQIHLITNYLEETVCHKNIWNVFLNKLINSISGKSEFGIK